MDIRSTLKEKEIFLHLVLLFLVSFFSNQYYGYIGLNPFDSFPVYNAAFNILNGKIPFKDYWIVHGPIIDFFQVNRVISKSFQGSAKVSKKITVRHGSGKFCPR